MEPATQVALIGVAGVLFTGASGFLATKLTLRQGARAQAAAAAAERERLAAEREQARATASTEDRRLDVEEWQNILSELRLEIKRLKERVLEVERLVSLRDESLRLVNEKYAALRAYVRGLITWAAFKVPEYTPPELPALVRDDFRGPDTGAGA